MMSPAEHTMARIAAIRSAIVRLTRDAAAIVDELAAKGVVGGGEAAMESVRAEWRRMVGDIADFALEADEQLHDGILAALAQTAKALNGASMLRRE